MASPIWDFRISIFIICDGWLHQQYWFNKSINYILLFQNSYKLRKEYKFYYQRKHF